MIRGVVNAKSEAVVRIRVRGSGHLELDVDAIVDSGFNDSLILPASTIVALGLTKQTGGRAFLADGSVRQFDLDPAEVSWDGVWQTVLVSDISSVALLGMRLLAGHELRISVVPGGAVEITAIP